jgi:hypothetical protein
MISLDFAELHNPLFLAGTNLNLKLDPVNRKGLILSYDREEKELLVEFNGKVAIIPSSNVSSMTPTSPADIGYTVAKPKVNATVSPITSHSNPTRSANTAPANGLQAANVAPKPVKVSAQVSGPQDHVHAGPGNGKN